MKRKLLILAGLFMMFQFGFSKCFVPSYEKTENKTVVYNDIRGKVNIKKVDFETFRRIDVIFGIDKNHVYYKGKIISGIDTKTFEIIQRHNPKEYPIYDDVYPVPTGGSCGRFSSSDIIKFRDKNGEYKIEDIRNGKLKLEE